MTRTTYNEQFLNSWLTTDDGIDASGSAWGRDKEAFKRTMDDSFDMYCMGGEL